MFELPNNSIFQCAFSRLGKQSVSSGWQSFCRKDTIVPKDILDTYSSIQTNNLITDSRLLGKKLDPVFEIAQTNDYLFLSKVKLGLVDELGRPGNIFSHGVVFNLDDDLLFHPSKFLSLDFHNFKDDYDSFVNSADSISFTKPLSIEESLHMLHLSNDKLKELVYSLYVALEMKKSLYIYEDSIDNLSMDKIRALLVVAYSLLPLEYRKMLSATTSIHNNDGFSLVFAKPGPNDFYFDLSDFSTNVEVPESYEYDYFRTRVIDSLDFCSDYFVRLENTYNNLKGESNKINKAYKHSDFILNDEYSRFSNDELHYFVYKLLSYNFDTPLANETISKIFCKFYDDGYVINETTYNELWQLVKFDKTTEYYNSAICVLLDYFYQLRDEETKTLYEILDNLDDIKLYQDLVNTDRAKNNLLLFTDYFDYSMNQCSEFADFKAVLDRLISVIKNEKISDVMADKISHKFETYFTEMIHRDNDDLTSFVDDYNNYRSRLIDIFDNLQIEESNDLYWKNIELYDFTIDRINIYTDFYKEGSSLSECFRILCEIVIAIKQNDFKQQYIYLVNNLYNHLRIISKGFSTDDMGKLWKELSRLFSIDDENKYTVYLYKFVFFCSKSLDIRSVIDEAERILYCNRIEDFTENFIRFTNNLSPDIPSEDRFALTVCFLLSYSKYAKLLDINYFDLLLYSGFTLYEIDNSRYSNIFYFLNLEEIDVYPGFSEKLYNDIQNNENFSVIENTSVDKINQMVLSINDKDYKREIKKWLKRYTKYQKRNRQNKKNNQKDTEIENNIPIYDNSINQHVTSTEEQLNERFPQHSESCMRKQKQQKRSKNGRRH